MPGFIPDVDAMHSCIPTFIVLITFTRRLIRLPRPGTWLAEGPQRQLRFPSFSASDSGLEAIQVAVQVAAGARVAAKMIKAVFHWDGAVQSPWQQVPVANRKEQQEEHKNI